jgi:hypothetical protein
MRTGAHSSFWRAPLLLLPLLLGMAPACADPASVSLFSLSYPTAFGVVCQHRGTDGLYGPVAIAECKAGEVTGDRLLAIVANGPTGDVGFIDLTDGDALDTNRMIPGYTRLHLGGYLSDLVAHPSSAQAYVLDTAGPRLIVIEPTTLEWSDIELPFVPGKLLVDPTGSHLLLTAPTIGQIGRLVLDEAGAPGELETFDIGGSPNALACSDDGSVLAVAHLHERHISLLDPENLTELTRVGIVEACQDGLDNDGDGLADRDDPGCTSEYDNDESDPALCAEPVVGEDEESDLDCMPLSEVPLCANGLDDDGDGKVDLDDAGCANRADRTENSDFLKLLDSDPIPFPCDNGVDDDGDELVDFPADPDCFARGADGERGLPAPMAALALSPDGRLAYIGYPGRLQLFVLDLDDGRLLNVNSIDDSLNRRLKGREGFVGIDFGYVPQAITFHAVEDRLYAYVSDDGGRTSRILVEEKGEPVHLADSATEEDDRTQAGKPRLYVDGEEIQLGFTPIAGVPNLGPLLIETVDEEANIRRFYGIDFKGDLRAHRNETWKVTYEGRLPGTSALEARLMNDGTAHVFGGSLCDIGALPGDLFEMVYELESKCGEFEIGATYAFPIAAVGDDFIELDSAGGEGRLEDGTVVTVGLPSTNCFGKFVSFGIRASETYVVSGTRTGFLHNVVSTPDGCIAAPDGDPLFTGRAIAAKLKDGAVLPTCPITEADDALELATYANPLLTFNIFPACEVIVGGGRNVIATERGTEWRFTVASGFVSQTILGAKSATGQLLSPAADLLYVLDLAARGIKEIGLDDFLLQASYF